MVAELVEWYEDGGPGRPPGLRAALRQRPPGSTPDALADVMAEVGFDLREDGEKEELAAAAFAPAECLTGVRVTQSYWGEPPMHAASSGSCMSH